MADKEAAYQIFKRELMASAAALNAGEAPERVAAQMEHTLRLVRDQYGVSLGDWRPTTPAGVRYA
jgi:hypothetical protein